LLEKEIKVVLAQRELKTSDVYKALGIDKVVFYQAIRTSNLNNKTLKKILDYLGLEISISLKEKENAEI
jgi:predicted transcriptional regulator